MYHHDLWRMIFDVDSAPDGRRGDVALGAWHVAVLIMTALLTMPTDVLRGQSYNNLERGGGGAVLHNNLQLNSGGLNEAVRRDRTGHYADAIVTGNVGGLHRFRGNIDYTAVDEFRGETAGDETFGFRARSVGPYAAGSAPRFGWAREGRVTIYRAATGASIGDVARPRLGAGDTDAMTLRDDVVALNLRSWSVSGARPINQTWRIDERRVPTSIQLVPASGRLLERRDDTLRIAPEPISQGAVSVFEPAFGPVSGPVLAGLDPLTPLTPPPSLTPLLPMTYSDLAIGSLRKDRRSDTPPPIDVKAVASGAGSRATLLATSDRPARRTSALEQIAEDFARTRLQQLVEPSDVNALAGVDLRFDPKRQAVDTLVGDDTTAFDEAMAQGERLIAAGDYFRAEDAYDLAIRLKGGDTAAHIGRVHAQLAAGLYLAAAHNLRRLFNAHPELIVQRYTQPVLPDADRIRVIEADLTRLLEDPKRMDVPLLLAYLSYQQDRTTIVNNALTTLSRRGGPDPLVDMLRRAWTGQAPEPAATKTPE